MKTVLVILLLILGLLQVRLWTGAGGFSAIARLEGEIATQTGQNAVLEARNQNLLDDVSDLKNGLDSIEERARSELGLIKKGETFFLIVEPDDAAKMQHDEDAGSKEVVPEASADINAADLLEIPPEITPGTETADEDTGQ